MKTAIEVFPAIAGTWPPERSRAVGPFLVPSFDPGGNRVSAARLLAPNERGAPETDISEAERAMMAEGRAPLFQVLDHQSELQTHLAARGYEARDHTDILLIESGALAAVPPPVTAFDIWPPLAIQVEIWEAGGIDAARRAVMDRAAGPKTSLFGRMADQPVGAAFIAIHGDLAMLHGLVVLPAGRRMGLASHMMRKAALWAESQGARWFCVLVTRENIGAQGLYASLGLKPVGTYHYQELRDLSAL